MRVAGCIVAGPAAATGSLRLGTALIRPLRPYGGEEHARAGGGKKTNNEIVSDCNTIWLRIADCGYGRYSTRWTLSWPQRQVDVTRRQGPGSEAAWRRRPNRRCRTKTPIARSPAPPLPAGPLPLRRAESCQQGLFLGKPLPAAHPPTPLRLGLHAGLPPWRRRAGSTGQLRSNVPRQFLTQLPGRPARTPKLVS